MSLETPADIDDYIHRLAIEQGADWRELAAALLLAPHLGAVAPYIRNQACIRLDHPRTPRGHCPCGKVTAS